MITITPINLPGITLTGNTNTMTTMKAFCQQFSNRGYTERQAIDILRLRWRSDSLLTITAKYSI